MTKKIHRRKKNNASRTPFFMGVGVALIALMAVLILLFGKKDEAESLTASADSPSSYSVTPSEVNYPAPEFALQNVKGNKEALTDYLDKVVLVNNWATWCP